MLAVMAANLCRLLQIGNAFQHLAPCNNNTPVVSYHKFGQIPRYCLSLTPYILVHLTNFLFIYTLSVLRVLFLSGCAEPHSPGPASILSRIDDSHCNMIHSSLTAVHCKVSAMVMCKSNQSGKNIVQSTGKKNSRKAWVGALAVTI